jgi:hypothetical protein
MSSHYVTVAIHADGTTLRYQVPTTQHNMHLNLRTYDKNKAKVIPWIN